MTWRISIPITAFFVLLLSLSSCSNKEKAVRRPDVFSLREMSELSTVEYTLTKVIKARDNKTWFKFGERKILMSCEAVIKAGIDMSAINDKNITVNDKSINVVLPQPKVLSMSIPAEKIKVEYEETGLLRDRFNSTDRDELAKQAEVQIRNSVEATGILNQAKVNTSMFVENFLKTLGYEQINISYSNGNTNPIKG